MNSLTTGQVAKLAEVNIHTVRYYEKRGLLPKPTRSSAGYRQYSQKHVAHICFIRRAQELGFALEEIRDLLDLRATPQSGPEIRKKTMAKIEQIDSKVHDLMKIRKKLAELAEACDRHGDSGDCLVLHALDDEAHV